MLFPVDGDWHSKKTGVLFSETWNSRWQKSVKLRFRARRCVNELKKNAISFATSLLVNSRFELTMMFVRSRLHPVTFVWTKFPLIADVASKFMIVALLSPPLVGLPMFIALVHNVIIFAAALMIGELANLRKIIASLKFSVC